MAEVMTALSAIEVMRQEQSAFVTNFSELETLRRALAEGPKDDSFAEDTSRLMYEKIEELNSHLPIVGGMPINGVRHASYFYTGEGDQPEESHWSPFSNFPFSGTLYGVEAVRSPDKSLEKGGLVACLVIDGIGESPVTQQIGLFNRMHPHTSHTNQGKRWIPVGGIEINGFDYSTEKVARFMDGFSSITRS